MKRVILPLVVLGLTMTAFADADLTSARIYRNQGEFIKAEHFFGLSIEKNPKQYVSYFERGELYGMIATDRTKKGVLRELVGTEGNPQLEMFKLMLADFAVVQGIEDQKLRRKQKRNLKKIDNIIEKFWTDFYNQSVDADVKHVEKLAIADSLFAAGDTTSLMEGSDTLTVYARALQLADISQKQVITSTDICILLMPNEWNPYALKAQVLDRIGNTEEANVIWERALVSLNASDLKAEDETKYMEAWRIIQLHLLQNHYNFDDYPKTVEVANNILELEPENQDAIIFRAFAMTNIVNAVEEEEKGSEEYLTLRDKTLTALQAAYEATPDDSAIPFYLGQFYLDGGDTTKTLDWWTTYTELDTADYEVLFQIGYIYLEGGSFIDYEKSESVYLELVTRHPDQCTGWINLGIAQIKQDNTKAGAENVKKGEDCSKNSGE